MFEEIVTKDGLKFNDLEKKIYKCMCQVDVGKFFIFFKKIHILPGKIFYIRELLLLIF